MINNNELQNEICKIVRESISEEKIKSMNLIPEEIIPTINLFKNIQRALIEMYFGNSCIYRDRTYYYSINLKDANINAINIFLLQKLCENTSIEFSLNNDTIKLSWYYLDIEVDIMKKYYYNVENIQNIKRQNKERNICLSNSKEFSPFASMIAHLKELNGLPHSPLNLQNRKLVRSNIRG